MTPSIENAVKIRRVTRVIFDMDGLLIGNDGAEARHACLIHAFLVKCFRQRNLLRNRDEKCVREVREAVHVAYEETNHGNNG